MAIPMFNGRCCRNKEGATNSFADAQPFGISFNKPDDGPFGYPYDIAHNEPNTS